MRINTINTQRYIFNDGVTSRLVPSLCILNYNTDQSYWDRNNKVLILSGYSEMRRGEPVS